MNSRKPCNFISNDHSTNGNSRNILTDRLILRRHKSCKITLNPVTKSANSTTCIRLSVYCFGNKSIRVSCHWLFCCCLFFIFYFYIFLFLRLKMNIALLNYKRNKIIGNRSTEGTVYIYFIICLISFICLVVFQLHV